LRRIRRGGARPRDVSRFVTRLSGPSIALRSAAVLCSFRGKEQRTFADAIPAAFFLPPSSLAGAALKDGKTNLTDASQLSGIGNLDDIDVSVRARTNPRPLRV
jgi:hypothetical protein